MAEYIERRALFNRLADYWNIPRDWDGGIAQPCEDAFTIIEDFPAADVVEVVRCKECALQSGCKVGQYLGNDGFCSYGERRKDG